MNSLSPTLLLYLLLQPLEVPQKHPLPLLQKFMNHSFVLGILRQFVLLPHCLVGIIAEVIILLSSRLQVGSIAETGQIVEGTVQPIVVEQQIPDEGIHFEFEASTRPFHQRLQQLQPTQSDKYPLSLQILPPNSSRYSRHQILPHPHRPLLLKQLHYLQRTSLYRKVLHPRVVLVSRTVNLQRSYPATLKPTVKDNLQQSYMTAHLVQSRSLVQRVQQLLQLLQLAQQLLLLHRSKILQLLQDLLNTLDLGAAVLLHRLLQPFLVLRRHLLELGRSSTVTVLKCKLQQPLPVNHQLIPMLYYKLLTTPLIPRYIS